MLHIFLVALGAIVVLEVPAHAYIDPGSTSLFLQGLIGGIAALIVLTRSWWQRGIARLRGDKTDSPDPK